MRIRPILWAMVLLFSAAQAAMAATVTGVWYTHRAKAKIKISRCGAGLCGRIVWLRDSRYPDGKPVRDERNRNPRYRTRKVLGLRTFSGLRPSGANRWSGVMYNPEDGRSYRANVTMTGGRSLRIDGCRIGGSACGSRSWTRAN